MSRFFSLEGMKCRYDSLQRDSRTLRLQSSSTRKHSGLRVIPPWLLPAREHPLLPVLVSVEVNVLHKETELDMC